MKKSRAPQVKNDNESLEQIRHSFAHLLAAAVKNLYPKAEFGIGPVIANGFYYDFGNINIGDKDLPRIEAVMRKIAKEGHAFKKELWPVVKARAHFKKEHAPYKLELIQDLIQAETPAKRKTLKVGMVYLGKDAFLDLCRGGHVKNTKDLPLEGFTLTDVAGAYWRGDEKRPMLTRIYGAAFLTQNELALYQKQLEEAEKRDHKKLGKELGLFTFSELVGSGLPLFTPKGTAILTELKKFSEELKAFAGYQAVRIPHITKSDLYRTSGHLEKFGDDIFYVQGKNDKFILKPMNCPHHTQIYASAQHSYKDMPVRFYETTTAYRDEQAGELAGLTRVRSLTTDDSHAFAREDQIEQEFSTLLEGVQKTAKTFGLEYKIRLSLRDEKNKKAYLGSDTLWQKAQKEMENILKSRKMAYEKAEGEAAFYGPKMDFLIKDSLGREWQLSTIQLDLNMPARFGLTYIDETGKAQTPVMIHSAFLGSLERFFGIIIEHFAGAFPLWLAPEQARILPISENFNAYGGNVLSELKKAGLRASLDDSNRSLGKKIREGEMQKIPYLLIVGEKEQAKSAVSVRLPKKGDIGSSTVSSFVKKVIKEKDERS